MKYLRYLIISIILLIPASLATACAGPGFEVTSAELVDAPELQSVRMLIRFNGDADYFLVRFQDFHNYWSEGTNSALLDLRDVTPGWYALDIWTDWDPQEDTYPWLAADSPKPRASYKVHLTLDPKDAPADSLADYRLMPGACEVEGDTITCALVYEKQ